MTCRLPLRAVLRNGETVLIREIGPDDRQRLREGFAKLSDQSRLFRFLAPHKDLSEAELDRFASENTDNHFAIGAASLGIETDMPVGTARFIRLAPGKEEAEFALTIIDSHQRLGLGSILLRTLAQEAQVRGIKTFIGVLHPDNTGMNVMMRHYRGHKVSGGGEEHWSLPLPLHAAPTLSRHPGEIAIIR